LESSKARLETFQTRCQLTRVVDERDILSRGARICVAVIIVDEAAQMSLVERPTSAR
jgi:hypothetical protein